MTTADTRKPNKKYLLILIIILLFMYLMIFVEHYFESCQIANVDTCIL